MAQSDPVTVSPKMLAALLERIPAGSDHLTLEAFIDCALYHPTEGYYKRARPRVGRLPDRDFYTASSLGKVFSSLVVEATRDLLGEDPMAYTFVEIGPESELGIMGNLPEAPFREVQLIRPGVTAQIPPKAIVFSNELFDAQPFRRLVSTSGGWKEMGVAILGNRLEWRVLDPLDPLPDLPDDLPAGYLVDWPEKAHRLLENICQQSWQGVFIAFDYGLGLSTILSERPQGTGRTYARHQMGNDLLNDPGNTDITCHVIWDALEEILGRHGFADIRLQRQEAFFMNHSQSVIREILEDGPQGFSPSKQTLMELLHPANMGHKFQVLSAFRRQI
ncbi:MAG TPA: SAM-dependent methyltransferase [Oceanipulchritudo sp.]|nr:SAM-dependent methyltransferase [Oceanipulchritudo sp.]